MRKAYLESLLWLRRRGTESIRAGGKQRPRISPKRRSIRRGCYGCVCLEEVSLARGILASRCLFFSSFSSRAAHSRQHRNPRPLASPSSLPHVHENFPCDPLLPRNLAARCCLSERKATVDPLLVCRPYRHHERYDHLISRFLHPRYFQSSSCRLSDHPASPGLPRCHCQWSWPVSTGSSRASRYLLLRRRQSPHLPPLVSGQP